jgi:hypothetical protein
MSEKSTKTETARADIRFDKRIIERSLSRGLVTQAEVDVRMKALVDQAANADNIAVAIWGPDGMH